MIHQEQVALSYITNEINQKYEFMPQQHKDTLIYACSNYVKGQISFENAQQIYSQVDTDLSFLYKLQRILTIENEPLPTPDPMISMQKKQFGSRKKSTPWTDIEDLRLVAAIFRFGAKDWRQIAEFVGNDRSSSQCNQRWCRAIDPNISHAPWSADEDQQLLHAVEVLGSKNWCQVAKIINRRTDLQCRYRFQQLTKKMKPNENVSVQQNESGSDDDELQAPQQPSLDEIAKHRRNSITIAPFIMPNIPKPLPKREFIPYYLESSMTPRTDLDMPMLHRVPPVLVKRSGTPSLSNISEDFKPKDNNIKKSSTPGSTPLPPSISAITV